MYTYFPTALEENFAIESGADVYIPLDAETLSYDIDNFAELEKPVTEKNKNEGAVQRVNDTILFLNATSLLSNTSYKTFMLSKIVSLIEQMDNIEEMIQAFLLLICQVCEVPLAALYLIENAGPHAYYICADEVGEKEIAEFLNVSETDFEKKFSNGSISKHSVRKLEAYGNLENYFNNQIKLSSYDCEYLSTDYNELIGSVHIVSHGNITSEKLNNFEFCIRNAASIFAKALVTQKKIFFEKRIRRAFSRFVPEQIIDSLVMQADASDQKIGVGETRAVAILFSDIRSFTNISERNRADVLVAFLNRYFSTMVEIIKKHGGTIDKFIGDAIMALFGTPVSYEDNCRRAVMAAYEMRQALPTVELGDLVMPAGMTFDIGIGIHYGDVIVGSIGSKDKTDYSVIGDNVNLASRMEGLTKTYGTQILVTESVRNDAGENAFCFRYMDDVRVKGKKNAVPIYAVDRSEEEFSSEYKKAYTKGMELYKQGIWNLGKDYFTKALDEVPDDKAAKLMLERCEEFIKNPPESWDGAIAFKTK
jgi:class 3 adenylate cyclase